ncbi:NAD-dependent epimerase/dehydratase family protein [Pseudoduganella danionis]|uniref:NAD-dependent epimerase/dehydratase family protein n=1 Tax=Pseudoduganella danionis TaxID=1890295 RepID=A0ABW9SJF7_9BURK|nr:NAD-dependent epimerase/dehydratase family protein [Pseudoduganella danionis]MTW31669.1 NAD-dependent epimerase/dehydratase family protein [Pseudoduganella danionis]
MIIGNGLLAQACAPHFRTRNDVLVFASGVSNSRETRAEEYAREQAMLEEALRLGLFTVYFSSCSVHDAELAHTPYVRHKRAMEALITARNRQMAIIRLPQVVGSTPNPYTLTNYLNEQITEAKPFQLWLRAWRNLIDVEDVAAIVAQLIDHHWADGVITNVACPFSVPVPELVHTFEQVLGRRAQYTEVDAGDHYQLDVELSMAAARAIGLEFGPDYIINLIRKYYGH